MKQALQLKHSQQLMMTPQLQQAIRLLQVSTLELQQEIQTALEINPLLESDVFGDDFDEPEIIDPKAANSVDEPNFDDRPPKDDETFDSVDQIQQITLSDELMMDTTWDHVYPANSGNTGAYVDEEQPTYQGETTDSLQSYLLWQLQLTPFTEMDHSIATALIEAIDERGYLTESCEAILEALNPTASQYTRQKDDTLTLEDVSIVLKRLQQFDPIGVAARSLQECLLLQLAQKPDDTPWKREAISLLMHHLALVEKKDFRTLQRTLQLKQDELTQVMHLISQLHPAPGETVIEQKIGHLIPDVLIYKYENRWQARLNNDALPKLRINKTYAAYAKTGNGEDNTFIREHLQQAKWLLSSIDSRNDTLLRVSNFIVNYQQDFFEYGPESMRPMILADVAPELNLHESTISRITTQKYLHSPRGLYELKYFFSSSINTDSGGECSSTAIRALITKFIANESARKPLSDNKIADLLEDQGIQVARRTIAKYRESLGIASSSQRKRLL